MREAEEKKKKRLESLGKWNWKKKYLLKRNNKERLNNNILIRIEFYDARGIVKWDVISNKVVFWDDIIV